MAAGKVLSDARISAPDPGLPAMLASGTCTVSLPPCGLSLHPKVTVLFGRRTPVRVTQAVAGRLWLPVA
jgi:hypothetical protein